MTTTINISLPKSMYEDAKKLIKKRRFSSMSELVRNALRAVLYPRLTENGFTPEFEEQVLKAAAEPIDDSKVWKSEEDIDRFFNKIDKKIAGNKKK